MGRDGAGRYATDGRERSLSQLKSLKINLVYGGGGNLGIDGDLVRWEASFLSERKVQIVNLLMGFGVRRNRGKDTSPQGICNISFVDDTSSTARGNSVRELCEKLQKANEAAIELGCRNDVQFNAVKTETLLVMRKRGRELRKQVQRARIIVCMIGGKEVEFAQEATQHLGDWLHHQTRLAKARKVKVRIRIQVTVSKARLGAGSEYL